MNSAIRTANQVEALEVPYFPRAFRRVGAIRADAEGRPSDAGKVWGELVKGHCRVVDTFFTDHRCYAVLKDAGVLAKPTALPDRHRDVLERVLLGTRQKVIALDLGVADSTVTSLCAEGLRAMGLGCGASRVPPILSVAAHASRRPAGQYGARLSRWSHGSESYRVLGADRPDAKLSAFLPPGELDVARQLLEGTTHAKIAERRGVSVRTIANQLAAVFHRFGVSGRAELLSHLLLAVANEGGRPLDVHEVPAVPLGAQPQND